MQLRWLALCACVLSVQPIPASAQSKDQPISGYMVCTIIEQISRPFPIADGATMGDSSRIMSQWRDAAQRWNGGRCFFGTRAEMEEEFADQHRKILAAMGTPGIVDFRPDWTRIIPSSRRGGKASSAGPAKAADKEQLPPKQSTAEAERARVEAREAREAEFQAKMDAHKADVADYQQKVAAREAEIARQQREHDAAQDEAEKAMAAHEAKMEAHRRKLAEAERAREEWLAVKRRHDRCMGGDQQACKDMDAGKPATPEQLADAGEAKTSDDEARSCVTEPVVSASQTFKGQIQAVVFNGCKTAVDVRICLLRTGGWNCGATWGLQPQGRWTHTTFQSQGGVFWDARTTGTNRPLASPGD